MSYQMYGEIPVYGQLEGNDTLVQIQSCAKEAVGAALMADHHLGYSMPIGGVVAYENKISPSGIGFDIACGNKAVRLDVSGVEILKNIKTIMDDIWKTISFGVGRKNEESVEHPMFERDGDPAWAIPEILDLKRKAAAQLGTVGSGNHYVDIFLDEENRVWIGVHFGSRGLGHSIATHYLKAAGGKDEMMAEPTLIDVDSDLGEQYLLGMHLAGRYAYAGRDWVCERVAKILGASIIANCAHNPLLNIGREFVPWAREKGWKIRPVWLSTEEPREEFTYKEFLKQLQGYLEDEIIHLGRVQEARDGTLTADTCAVFKSIYGDILRRVIGFEEYKEKKPDKEKEPVPE